MPRDPEIKKVFEIADDSLQGLFGYCLYVTNAARCASEDCILTNLPPDRIPITHAWDRYYLPQELVSTMGKLFEPYQTRVCLVALVNVFEAASRSFAEHLERTGRLQSIPGNKRHYVNRLRWVFDKVAKSSIGDSAIQVRIPDLCLDVDHGRRLRNIAVHNNGLFDDQYEKGIEVAGQKPRMHPDFGRYAKDRNKPIPMILSAGDYLRLSKSHIELLHVLHHEIQRQDFGYPGGYSYRDEKKRIEWHRLLIGH